MSQYLGAVYDPPASGFPLIVVFVDESGKVIETAPVSSRAEGEALIIEMLAKLKLAAQKY